ncbi:MAG: hypothetical protein M3367_10115, partial [Acidobacteriota bacterium]|nr:hypothetical protein [Acidobacteriota bacterium]
LPFHLGAIFSFTDGQNFPPENPSYAFAKFSYPFMADLVTASLVALSAKVREALLVQNVFLAFSLLVILERFTFKLTGSRLAGKIAPVLLFFSGGLGFLWFFKDFWQQTQGFFDFIRNLQHDYTTGDNFRWGNSLITLFVTQRSLLLGMPLTIIVLQKLWEVFNRDKGQGTRDELNYKTDTRPSSLATRHCFFVGLLAGTLPLIHVHSLVVLFVVSAFLFFFRADRWREWIAFGAGVSVLAVPELIWAMTGSATRLTEFVGWNFGWDLRGENFIWFWLKNLGIFIPILIFGIYLTFNAKTQRRKDAKEEREKNKSEIYNLKSKIEQSQIANRKSQILFYIPFALCFVVANLVKLAPWEWDNIKVLIYWFVGSLPFAAFCLAWLWNKDRTFKIIAVGCLVALTFSGALDVWRVASKQINYKVFDKDAVAVSEQIKQKTVPNALFLNAPTYNSAVALSGRRSLMRYIGHLSSYGIDYQERETEVKKIYSGDPAAEIILKKYDIEYVLISPEEKSNLTVNEEFFRRFPIAAEAGQYRVYQVNK